MPGAILVYVYEGTSSTTEMPASGHLSADRLLIAPFWINRLPWTKGYFVTVGAAPLGPGDLLKPNCFHDHWKNSYRNEVGEVLGRRTEPCGSWGLGSYRMLDDLISDALGIPRVPDEERRQSPA
jgi:hypothetical protein